MIKDPMNGKHVTLVALGPSSSHYVHLVEAMGRPQAYSDETWTVNSFGAVIHHDRLFHMDDVRLIMRETDPKMVEILKMLKKHPGPVYTSRPHEDFPCMVPYPLEDVINDAGTDYLNNTVAYALALLCAVQPRQVSLFGIDFQHMDSHDAPAGRECCEYWLGRLHQRGVATVVANRSPIMDTNRAGKDGYRPLYGYETTHVKRSIVMKDRGLGIPQPWMAVELTPKDESDWPAAPAPAQPIGTVPA